MTMTTHGRHRAVAARRRTTLISESMTSGASTYRRRSAVLAASSGLVVTMGLPAVAAPAADFDEGAAADTTASLSVVPATSGATTTGSISVPPDARVDPALGALTAVDTARAERAATAARETSRAERAAAATRASRATADRSGGTGQVALAGAAVVEPVAQSASAALEVGTRYIGTPYRFGGNTPAGFDCSGFIQYVYGQLGISLPRTAGAQARAGTRVSARDARPGDIVSFVGGGRVTHNGIYVGNGKMLDSPRSGKSIAVRSIWSSSITFTRVG